MPDAERARTGPAVVVTSPATGRHASLWPPVHPHVRIWETAADIPRGDTVVVDHAGTAQAVGATHRLYPLRIGTRVFANADQHAWHATGSGLFTLPERAAWVAKWAAHATRL